jgi:hypothetical protein
LAHETAPSEQQKFSVHGPEKDWTDPENFCSHALISWANFYDIALAQKGVKKAKDWTWKH